MTGGKTKLDETEIYKRKLQALEGDKAASVERLSSQVTANQTAIADFREENKEIEKKLRQLKNQPKTKHGAGLGPHALEVLDQKVCTAIKKHNATRAEADRKERELVKLQQELLLVTSEENQLKNYNAGTTPESIRVRELENELQKSMDKHKDAMYITQTYNKIIDKLNQDRLEFDNTLLELETRVKESKDEIKALQDLCNNAERARDEAKEELAACDRAATSEREEREREKKELLAIAEEQHRKYEAMERLMKSSHGDASRLQGKEDTPDSVAEQLQTNEGMMRRIQEATGVMNVHEVLERFKSQKDTEEKLTKLKEESTGTLANLKTELESLEKTYEALKYSGEARTSSNSRMVAEFEKYLSGAQESVEKHEADLLRNEALLVQVRTGVDHIYDKLATLEGVKFVNADNTNDKLEEAKLRLEKLIAELDQRKSELADIEGADVPMIVPENNVRIPVAQPNTSDTKPAEEEEHFHTDNEAVSRDQIKRQAQIIVDQNATLPGMPKKGGKRR